jgi:hypothetical protein
LPTVSANAFGNADAPLATSATAIASVPQVQSPSLSIPKTPFSGRDLTAAEIPPAANTKITPEPPSNAAIVPPAQTAGANTVADLAPGPSLRAVSVAGDSSLSSVQVVSSGGPAKATQAIADSQPSSATTINAASQKLSDASASPLPLATPPALPTPPSPASPDALAGLPASVNVSAASVIQATAPQSGEAERGKGKTAADSPPAKAETPRAPAPVGSAAPNLVQNPVDTLLKAIQSHFAETLAATSSAMQPGVSLSRAQSVNAPQFAKNAANSNSAAPIPAPDACPGNGQASSANSVAAAAKSSSANAATPARNTGASKDSANNSNKDAQNNPASSPASSSGPTAPPIAEPGSTGTPQTAAATLPGPTVRGADSAAGAFLLAQKSAAPGSTDSQAATLAGRELPPDAAPSPVQMAQMMNKTAQSEMRIGMATAAFGNVEIRTTVHANDVGVLIGSEKGDLRSLLSAELPGIAHTLQQHDLRLNQVNFQQGFASSSDLSSGSDARPRYFAPPARGSTPLPDWGGNHSEAGTTEHPGEVRAGLNILA